MERFDIFLPPTGRVVLRGPDPSRLPTTLEGLYQILLRVEASDDKESDSNLANAGAGTGVIHSGAVAGFPLPTLRYYVGSAREASDFAVGSRQLQLLQPPPGGPAPAPLIFVWAPIANVLLYRLEVEKADGSEELLSAVVQQGIASYGAPPWLSEKAAGQALRWRVVSLGPGGRRAAVSPWRELSIE